MRISSSALALSGMLMKELGIVVCVAGLEIACNSMCHTERSQFIVEPLIAYGSLGHGRIPSDSTILFDITMLDLKPCDAIDEISSLSFEELQRASFSKRLQAAKQQSDIGNQRLSYKYINIPIPYIVHFYIQNITSFRTTRLALFTGFVIMI